MLVDDRAEPEVVKGILLRQLVRRPLHEFQVTGWYTNRVEDRNEDALVVARALCNEIQRSLEIV